jgi:hypothetical protein
MRVRSTIAGLLFGLCLVTVGCVESKKGLALPDRDDSVFEESLLGEWTTIDIGWPKSKPGRMLIERPDPRSNVYRFRDLAAAPDSPFSSVDARLYRIEDTLFWDILCTGLATDPAEAEKHTREGTLPMVHLICRVRRRDNRFMVEHLDVKFLKERSASLPQHIWGHLKGNVRITATPEQLRAFLSQVAGTEPAWAKTGRTLFRKVEAKASAQGPCGG